MIQSPVVLAVLALLVAGIVGAPLNDTSLQPTPTPDDAPIRNNSTSNSSSDVTYYVIKDANGKMNEDGASSESLVSSECVLRPESGSFAKTLQEYLTEGVKLINYHLKIRNETIATDVKRSSNMYRPDYWVRSTGRHGTGLLFLHPDFDVLSFMTLSYGVIDMSVNLIDEPENCTQQVQFNELEGLVRDVLLHDFQNATLDTYETSFDADDQVCNMHILNSDGKADFRYYCCYKTENHEAKCYYLKPDFWRNVLFAVIVVLKIIVLLFCPRLVPGTWYRLKSVAMSYTHRLESEKQFKMKTIVTTNPDKFGAVSCTKVRFKHLQHMSKFSESLCNMSPDIPHTFSMNEIKFKAKFRRLIPEDYAPVGLFGVLFSELFKCNMRKKPAVKGCCEASICCWSKSIMCPWYVVLKRIMRSVLFLLISTPWIIRLFIYFAVETEEMSRKKTEASERNLSVYFPGNFTLLLTPLHVLFVVIYVLLVLESFTYSSLRRKAKEKVRFVLRKCFQDMRDTDQLNVIAWLVRITLKPYERLGILGILIGPLVFVVCLPFLVCVLAFYMLPTVNITCRLLAHFLVYLFPKDVCQSSKLLRNISKVLQKAEDNLEMETIASMETLEKDEKVLSSNWRRLQQLVIIFVCLVSLYSIIFLFTEFISFIVEVIIYTVMGLILNASVTLTHVSFVLLLGVYARDCFGNVRTAFLDFNKIVHDVVLEHGKENMRKALWNIGQLKHNLAFRINSNLYDNQSCPVDVRTNNSGRLRWGIKNMLLFIGNKQTPMIPVKFFFEACVMPYYHVPGRLLIRYVKAMLEFCTIITFLLFVLLVVMAFGDTYQLSATNQVLATLAGGFIPFALRNFVFQSFAAKTIDTDNVYFQSTIGALIDRYHQQWPVDDIDVVPVRIHRSVHDVESDAPHTPKNGTNGILPDSPASPGTGEDEPILSNGHDNAITTTDQDHVDLDLLVIATERELHETPRSSRSGSSGSSTGSYRHMVAQEMQQVV